MNERIEKLSQLAWTKTSETVPFYDSTGNISRDFNFKYQQVFAELIVKMCADAADMAYDARCEYVGDYVAEYMGYGEEEGIAIWRTK